MGHLRLFQETRLSFTQPTVDGVNDLIQLSYVLIVYEVDNTKTLYVIHICVDFISKLYGTTMQGTRRQTKMLKKAMLAV